MSLGLADLAQLPFTTLTGKDMPLIRYCTGDISRFLSGDCPCGTRLKSLECIHPRIDEAVEIGEGGKLSINDLDEVLFSNNAVFDFDAAIIQGLEIIYSKWMYCPYH